jgi:hypothetical protein
LASGRYGLFVPGAFEQSLQRGGFPLLINHAGAPLVRQGPMALVAWERPEGLFFSALIRSFDGRQRLDHGRLQPRGASLGWTTQASFVDEDGIERITEAHVVEISLLLSGEPAVPGSWATIET